MKLEFTILGQPVAKGRPHISTRCGYPIAYTPTTTRLAEANLRSQLISQLPQGFTPLQGAIRLDIIVTRDRPKSLPKKVVYPTTRSDLDNYIKLCLDAMNSIVFRDDAQVVELYAKKEYGIPATVITVTELV